VKRGVASATFFVLVGIAVLVSLGAWQLQRKTWKENLIATLTARVAAPPQALPLSPNRSTDEFTRVRLHGAFIPGQSVLVFTSGSALRPDVTAPGYWVLSPLRTDDGRIVVVNRGYVAGKSAAPPPSGEVELVGALRWPDEAGLFTPADEPGNDLWYRRDPVAIGAAKGWGQVAPFVVEQETPQLAGAPQAGPLVVRLRDAHLQYAITWFGLAAGLAGVYLVWLRGRLRRA
jgi:cytochrome oxidase assembly protein ShyY1